MTALRGAPRSIADRSAPLNTRVPIVDDQDGIHADGSTRQRTAGVQQ